MLLVAHLLLHHGLGALLAALSAARTPSRWLLCGALYLDLLTLAPLVAYQARLWPAYALSYAFDPLLVPALYAKAAWLSLVVLVALPGSLAAGFWLATRALLVSRRALAHLYGAAAALSAVAILALSREDWLTIADFASFWRGGGSPIWRHVHAQLIALSYVLAAALLVHRRWRARPAL